MEKSVLPHNKTIISVSTERLILFIAQTRHREIECVRIGRAGWALVAAGLKPGLVIFLNIAAQLLDKQSPDGGWSDPEETAWTAGVIRAVRGPKEAGFAAAKKLAQGGAQTRRRMGSAFQGTRLGYR